MVHGLAYLEAIRDVFGPGSTGKVQEVTGKFLDIA